HVDDLAGLTDALTIEDVELGLAEWWGHLVLDHLHFGPVAKHILSVLDLARAADVQSDGSIELQGISTGCGLGVAEHHADLFTELVNEDAAASGLADGAG